jgi:glycosyltransferase involved in cell wall biosynthesis
LKVLHITSWYPTEDFPHKALWIKRHIESLPTQVDSKVYHIEILVGKYNFQVESVGIKHKSYLIRMPFQIWRLNELIYFTLLCYVLFFKERKQHFDILNVHVAYPILRYFHWIHSKLTMSVIISEHWSAYHYHFNIKGSIKLKPIQNIFKQGLPVITVSKSLGKDISTFSDATFRNYVVPNVVDSEVFNLNTEGAASNSEKYFLMVSQWKAPKLPLLAIESFLKFHKVYSDIFLHIIGYGPQIREMKLAAQGVENIVFLDEMPPTEIAKQMKSALGLIHVSDYETFSVVCAEALACGCPVAASKVGGIPEFVNEGNGVLIDQNTEEFVFQALMKLYFKRPKVKFAADFSAAAVGKQYFEVLKRELVEFVK